MTSSVCLQTDANAATATRQASELELQQLKAALEAEQTTSAAGVVLLVFIAASI